MINKNNRNLSKKDFHLTSKTLSVLRRDLRHHFMTLRNFTAPEGPVKNPMIKGHFEAHFEKMDTLIFEMNDLSPMKKLSAEKEGLFDHRFSLPKKMVTESQALKLMHRNLKLLSLRLSTILSKNRTRMDEKTLYYCKELYRKISNDQWRTAYILQ